MRRHVLSPTKPHGRATDTHWITRMPRSGHTYADVWMPANLCVHTHMHHAHVGIQSALIYMSTPTHMPPQAPTHTPAQQGVAASTEGETKGSCSAA